VPSLHMAILQNDTSWAVRYLPSWGTFALFALLVFLTYWRERGWKTVAEQRKERIGELDLKIEKLEVQHIADTKEIAGLHERTDLKPLTEFIDKWVNEGRGRFDKADAHLAKNDEVLASMHAEQTSLMQDLSNNMRDLGASLKKHMDEDHASRSEDSENTKSIASILTNLEQRSRVNTELYSALLEGSRGARRRKVGGLHQPPGGQQQAANKP